MVKNEVLLTAIFALALLPGAQAFQPVYSCIDDWSMEVVLDINDSGNLSRISQDLIPCPHGCMNNIGRYGADCLNAPQAMPIEFYLLILLLAGSLLALGVWRQRWLFCMSSSILFIYIAFQSFNIVIMSQSYFLPQLVMLSWFASIIAMMFTMIGAVQYAMRKNSPQDEDYKKPRAG